MRRASIIPVISSPALHFFTNTTLPGGIVGVAYSKTFAAVGGRLPYSWVISSTTGTTSWSLNPATGVLTGTPGAVETDTLVVQLSDNSGQRISQTFSIQIIAGVSIVTGGLPNATVGTPYSATLTANGGSGIYTWTIVSDTPDTGSWLSVNPSTGVLSGTPGTAETETIVIKVQDSVGSNTQKTVSLTVVSTVTPPGVASIRVGSGATAGSFIDRNGNRKWLGGGAMVCADIVGSEAWASVNSTAPGGSATLGPNFFNCMSLFGDPAAPVPAPWAGLNFVRITLNECMINNDATGGTVVNTGGSGATIRATPTGRYLSSVGIAVDKLTSAGIVVMLDLHLTAPSNFVSQGQQPFLNADNSLRACQTLASMFGNNVTRPNGNNNLVVFEPFNEPFILDSVTQPNNDGCVNRVISGICPQPQGPNVYTILKSGTPPNGANFYEPSSYVTGYPKFAYNYQLIGFDTIVKGIRALGATNPIGLSGTSYSVSLDWWLQNPPDDYDIHGNVLTSAPQLFAIVHMYPNDYPYDWMNGNVSPGNGGNYPLGLATSAAAAAGVIPAAFTAHGTLMQINQKYPIVIGECSDNDSSNAYMSRILQVAQNTGSVNTDNGITHFWDPNRRQKWNFTFYQMTCQGGGNTFVANGSMKPRASPSSGQLVAAFLKANMTLNT